jgi:hypothetical protein
VSGTAEEQVRARKAERLEEDWGIKVNLEESE